MKEELELELKERMSILLSSNELEEWEIENLPSGGKNREMLESELLELVEFKEWKAKVKKNLASGSVAEPINKKKIIREVVQKEKDYGEIRLQVIREVVQKNLSEWRVEKICVFDGDYGSRNGNPNKFGGGYKEGKIALIHKEFVAKYDNYGILITKDNNSGKIHYKDAFTADEGNEIESIVNNQQGILEKDEKVDDLPTRGQGEIGVEGKKGQFLNKSNENFNSSDNKFPASLIIGGIILLTVVGFTALFIIRKNDKKIKKKMSQ